MADPATLPSLKDWNDQQLAKAVLLVEYAPSGVQCPNSVSELLDVPETTSTSKVGGLMLSTVQVVCPDCGFAGERFL